MQQGLEALIEQLVARAAEGEVAPRRRAQVEKQVAPPPPGRAAAPLRPAPASAAVTPSVRPAASAPPASPQAVRGLLADFSGGEPLLRALVLAEALAPPLGLRPRNPGGF